MIRIKDDYVILVDDNEYTAAIDCRKKDKMGYDLYKHIGYYSNLESALNGLYAYMIRKGLSEMTVDLPEAIKYVSGMHNEMKQMISDAAKDF